MAIAPITGKLRKRFWLDVGTALALGMSGGYAYWSVHPRISWFGLLTLQTGMDTT